MALTRRSFLTSSLATVGVLSVPRATAWAAPGEGVDSVLVVLFQRGAADALNLVVPHGDADYYVARPTVRVDPGSELDLDGFFGLHPGLADLLPLYQSGDLALVHAVGSQDPTRSHFDAQDFMERAAPGDFSQVDGWLNRALTSLGSPEAYAGITLDASSSLALRGPHPAISFGSIQNFQLSGSRSDERQAALESVYAAEGGQWLTAPVGAAFGAVDLIQQVDRTTSVTYPNSGLARDLRDAAALIKADIGVRIVSINTGGWDTHSDELARLDRLNPQLAASLAAFQQDLGSHSGRTVLVSMTEFGRTAGENDAFGTEHGHGGVMLALGDAVNGGRVVLANDTWPGLDEASLYQGRDLQVTTDFRDLFAELLDRHLGIADPDAVLPGFSSSPTRYPGIIS